MSDRTGDTTFTSKWEEKGRLLCHFSGKNTHEFDGFAEENIRKTCEGRNKPSGELFWGFPTVEIVITRIVTNGKLHLNR